MRTRAWIVAVLVLAMAGEASAAPTPANRCLVLQAGEHHVAVTDGGFEATAGRRGAAGLHFKPVALGTYLLSDPDGRLMSEGADAEVARASTPSRSAEWRVRRRGNRWTIRSEQSGRALTIEAGRLVLGDAATRFRLRPAKSCRRYPEAGVNARGRPARGRVRGFADAHVHITANLRAGGNVISGLPFHRYGVPEALGHDADSHGQDGILDVTGNLLRSGSPVGTHDTHGWPTFAGWPAFDTFTHQQVYWRWLQRAWMGGLRLVVAQTVEDEPLCRIEPLRTHDCDETATIEMEIAQLRALQDYVDAQHGGRGRGWFRLVFGPRQAERVIRAGKLAVIIGVESSNPFGCSQVLGTPRCDRAQIDRGIAHMRRLGVRSIFIAHWVDNALGGAALEGGDKGLFISAMQVEHTGEPFRAGACPEEGQGEEVLVAVPEDLSPGGRKCNVKGLTELGEYAVARLMDARMLIEVDHLGEYGRDRLLDIAEQRRYPVVSSHTGTGGTWSARELRQLYETGGIASATIPSAAELPGRVLGLREHQVRGPVGIPFSTDTGGFAEQPAPDPSRPPLAYPFRSYDGRVLFGRQQTGERTFDVNADGVAHYGLLPDLLAQVQREKDGPRAMRALHRAAGAYLRTWRRTGQR